MEHIDLAKCILISCCNEYDDDDQPLLKIGYERWLGDVDVQKLIKNKDITKILWPDIAITNKSSFRKQLKKANFEEKLVQVLALGGEYNFYEVFLVTFKNNHISIEFLSDEILTEISPES